MEWFAVRVFFLLEVSEEPEQKKKKKKKKKKKGNPHHPQHCGTCDSSPGWREGEALVAQHDW
jgi:hypothetical protein